MTLPQRVSGRTSAITNVVLEFERDETLFRYNPTAHNPDTVAGVLKLYLRQLPAPVFPLPPGDRASLTKTAEVDMREVLHTFSKKLRRLPPANQATLKEICEHLSRCARLTDIRLSH